MNSNNKIILVDMDGVIADFDSLFLAVFKRTYPGKPFIPLKKRKSFYPVDDYYESFGFDKDELKKIYQASGFFVNLQIIDGAKEALQEMASEGFNVFLCTSPLDKYENCVLEKFQWVEKNLGREWVNKIILTKDKTVVFGDFLIDDKPRITGINANPKWTHIIFDQPYNKEILDKKRLTKWSNWRKIIEEETI